MEGLCFPSVKYPRCSWSFLTPSGEPKYLTQKQRATVSGLSSAWYWEGCQQFTSWGKEWVRRRWGLLASPEQLNKVYSGKKTVTLPCSVNFAKRKYCWKAIEVYLVDESFTWKLFLSKKKCYEPLDSHPVWPNNCAFWFSCFESWWKSVTRMLISAY